MLGPCAKKQVRAVAHLYREEGERTEKGINIIVGGNLCTNPQSTCPRAVGEGYHKCFSVCGQLGHAEDVLLRQLRLRGITADMVERVTVFNHDRPCDSCRALLDAAGLLGKTTFKGDNPDDLGRMDPFYYKGISEAYHLIEPSSHSSHHPRRAAVRAISDERYGAF